MTSTIEEPSQAERLEAVAEAGAGAGAEDKRIETEGLSANPANGVPTASSSGSDLAEGAKIQEKPEAKPDAPQRSAGKVALIMGSLCVCGSASGKLAFNILTAIIRLPSFLLPSTRSVYRISFMISTANIFTDNHHDCRSHN